MTYPGLHVAFLQYGSIHTCSHFVVPMETKGSNRTLHANTACACACGLQQLTVVSHLLKSCLQHKSCPLQWISDICRLQIAGCRKGYGYGLVLG